MKKQRPVNLDLKTIWFPITAIVSILHRISGVILFVAIGIFLWIIELSLSSSEGFLKATAIMDNIIVRFILWNILTVFFYHIISGIRHILVDFGCLKETLIIGKTTASITFLLTIILSILAGFFLW